ncbi:hypothetical protein [Erythrobacter sp.]|nr:hypothetical protein [Erythrobacter sp.]
MMNNKDRVDPQPDRGKGPPDGKGRPVDPGRPVTPSRPAAGDYVKTISVS